MYWIVMVLENSYCCIGNGKCAVQVLTLYCTSNDARKKSPLLLAGLPLGRLRKLILA